ncbi:sucrose-phosphate synthase [Poseidonocella pacifica]|uniref:sucrose-phosphate synthase n=1 Tax=Poseidonocella pacifica TaxID=871651 RepID=A0A1I0X564_9RHOB|nr:HAD-IIB family hydrolase [Poseidonocella pacifica]SFA95974.1 sucrose-phosphate synthase [Poseidonocella pacifica]
MRIMHVALGGCLSAPPVPYGLTEDTGGHIAYILGAARAQAALPGVKSVEIVTRLIEDPALGARYSAPVEPLCPYAVIRRIRTQNTKYLEKEALEAELPALRAAFLAMLERGQRPDVLHAHFADAAVLCFAAAQRFGIRWVYTPHSLGLGRGATDSVSGALERRIEREQAAIRRADAIITSSRDEAERQVPAYDAQAAGRVLRFNPGLTQPVGAGPERARDLIAPFLRKPEKPAILAIARPVAKKNLAALVSAYAGSPDLQERANLVIVAGVRAGLTGNACATNQVISQLFDLVDKHDLWGRVALPRKHNPEDIPSFYALAARGGLFVNPALHEPFGLTLIEAAQAGVPIAATDNGGPVDILDQLGYPADRLIDAEDTGSIARACLASLNDPAREDLAAEAQARAIELFNWDRWAEDVLEAYRSSPPLESTPEAPERLLVSDIDGTLTGSRAGAAAFGAYHAEERDRLAFAVATGRSISEARRVLQHWALPEPDVFITSVGTEIWKKNASGALTLDQSYARAIGQNWHRSGIAKLLGRLNIPMQASYEQREWKLSGFGDRADAALIREALLSEGLTAHVIPSHGRFIDVVPQSAGKWAAARHAAVLFGLSEGACICAGDSGNDLDMLRHSPAAILPANAHSELNGLENPGLYRASRPYADGVIEGLQAHLPRHLSMAAE